MTAKWALDLARIHFPKLSNEELNDLLWSLTAYPFGDAEYISKQLIKVKETTNGK